VGGIATATATATGNGLLMPQAILLSDVESLGERGAVVDVSKGYLRNYLVPRKLAAPATAGSIAAASQRAAAADRAARQAAEQAQETAALLSRTVLTIAQQAGDDGRLFGSVTPQDIVDAISESRGLKLDRRGVALDEPIKNVGTYMVVVEVAAGVNATIKTIVTPA
jgi:large subunit ribosomal protein L9